MDVARRHRPIVSLVALVLAVAANSLSAPAQAGSDAVVCVGSENRIHQEEGSHAKDDCHGTRAGLDAPPDVVGTLRFERGRRVLDWAAVKISPPQTTQRHVSEDLSTTPTSRLPGWPRTTTGTDVRKKGFTRPIPPIPFDIAFFAHNTTVQRTTPPPPSLRRDTKAIWEEVWFPP